MKKSWFSSGVRWSGAGRLLCLCWPGPRQWKSFWFTIFPSLMVIFWGCQPIWDCNANDTVSFWSSLLDGNKPHTEMTVTDLQIDEVLEEAAASLDKHELGISGGGIGPPSLQLYGRVLIGRFWILPRRWFTSRTMGFSIASGSSGVARESSLLCQQSRWQPTRVS